MPSCSDASVHCSNGPPEMGRSLPWCRLHVEMPRDYKIRRLDARHRWLWVVLLCLAGESRVRGVLLVGDEPMSDREIADAAALSTSVTTSGLAAIEAAGMIYHDDRGAWVVTNWNDRQRESDNDRTNAERSRKHREKKRNADATRCATVQEGESDTEPDSENLFLAETEKNSVLAALVKNYGLPRSDEARAYFMDAARQVRAKGVDDRVVNVIAETLRYEIGDDASLADFLADLRTMDREAM